MYLSKLEKFIENHRDRYLQLPGGRSLGGRTHGIQWAEIYL